MAQVLEALKVCYKVEVAQSRKGKSHLRGVLCAPLALLSA